MTDVLFIGNAFRDTAVEGLTYRRSFEVYGDASNGVCGPASMGEGRDLNTYPLLVAGVKTPGGVQTRVSAVYYRKNAPAIVTLTVPREALLTAINEDETVLLVTLAAVDSAGNELPLIPNGELLITRGGL